MVCKSCNKDKPRIFRKKCRAGRAIYHDGTGRRWWFYKCPDCQESESKEESGIVRYCRNKECKDVLPAHRYFHCERCKPEICEDFNEDFLYAA